MKAVWVPESAEPNENSQIDHLDRRNRKDGSVFEVFACTKSFT